MKRLKQSLSLPFYNGALSNGVGGGTDLFPHTAERPIVTLTSSFSWLITSLSAWMFCPWTSSTCWYLCSCSSNLDICKLTHTNTKIIQEGLLRAGKSEVSEWVSERESERERKQVRERVNGESVCVCVCVCSYMPTCQFPNLYKFYNHSKGDFWWNTLLSLGDLSKHHTFQSFAWIFCGYISEILHLKMTKSASFQNCPIPKGPYFGSHLLRLGFLCIQLFPQSADLSLVLGLDNLKLVVQLADARINRWPRKCTYMYVCVICTEKG